MELTPVIMAMAASNTITMVMITAWMSKDRSGARASPASLATTSSQSELGTGAARRSNAWSATSASIHSLLFAAKALSAAALKAGDKSVAGLSRRLASMCAMSRPSGATRKAWPDGVGLMALSVLTTPVM